MLNSKSNEISKRFFLKIFLISLSKEVYTITMQILKKHFTLPYLFTVFVVFIGGFLELYSIKTRGIYCAMQTGNLLNIFVAVSSGQVHIALLSVMVLITFLLGCFLSQLMKRAFLDHRCEKYYYATVLVIESLLLIPTFFIPIEKSGVTNGGTLNIYDVIADCFLALYGSLHFIAFHEENHHSYTPTMMTNMMKNVVIHLADGIHDKNKEELTSSLSYFLLVLCFILGAMTFYLLFHYLPSDIKNTFLQYILSFIMLLNLLLIPFSFVVYKREHRED